MSRCPDCERPLATEADRHDDDEPHPEDDLLCWREYNRDTCQRPVDWRARAVGIEATLVEVVAERDATRAERDRAESHAARAEKVAERALAEIRSLTRALDIADRARVDALQAHADAQAMLEEVAAENERLSTRLVNYEANHGARCDAEQERYATIAENACRFLHEHLDSLLQHPRPSAQIADRIRALSAFLSAPGLAAAVRRGTP